MHIQAGKHSYPVSLWHPNHFIFPILPNTIVSASEGRHSYPIKAVKHAIELILIGAYDF